MLNLRAINKHHFTRAKTLWTISNVLKFFVFAVGIVAVFSPERSEVVPYIVFVLAVSSELVQWRSDIAKSRSEALLRKLDFCRSFGGEISEADKRDIASYIPKSLREKFHGAETSDTYFESREPPGTRKAAENLAESAWYSRELSGYMATFSVIVIVLVVLIAIGALIFASNNASSTNTLRGLSRVVTAWLLLIVSLGLFRNAWGYYKFKERADKSYNMARHLLTGEVTMEDALSQWHEYQVGRASSPLIPDKLWDWKKDELNDAWSRAKD
jgi:hypothetical protein